MANRPTRIGFILALLALLALLAITGCFNVQSDGAQPDTTQPEKLSGGGGVETTEGNLASLAASPMGARVSLIPEDFDPLQDTLPDSMTVLADAQGAYRFRGLAPGRYNLEAHHPSDGTRCFRPGVVIAKGDSSIAGTDTLAVPGRIRLSWEGSRRGVLTQTGRLFRLDLDGLEADSGGITIDSLPAGLLPPFTFTDAVDSASYNWTDSVRVEPGVLDSVPIKQDSVPVKVDTIPAKVDTIPAKVDTIPAKVDTIPAKVDTIPIQEAWAHAATLTLDMADVAPDSLDGYPLLVRLASPEFTFSEAGPGGADLRFTTEDGIVLPHAVESWDSAAGRAEIWVRLKAQPGTAFGTLRMEWGNPAAVYRAGSVFGSVTGHQSIWHLDEDASGGLLEDAGPRSLGASAVGLVPESQGAIGGAQRFDGIGAYASAADSEPAQTPAHLCVSAWIIADTTGMWEQIYTGTTNTFLTVLSNWRESGSDSTGFILEYMPEYKEVLLTLGFGSKLSRVVVPPLENAPYGSWHLLAATYDGAEATVWLDGKPMKSSAIARGDLPLPSREYLIGATATGDPKAAKANFFKGKIDEARVFRSVPPRAWLSLDFRTQQPGSNPLRFQKLR